MNNYGRETIAVIVGCGWWPVLSNFELLSF